MEKEKKGEGRGGERRVIKGGVAPTKMRVVMYCNLRKSAEG